MTNPYFDYIQNYLAEFAPGYEYNTPIKSEESLIKIYNLMKYFEFTEPNNAVEYYYYSLFYKYMGYLNETRDYFLSKAIDMDYGPALNEKAYTYEKSGDKINAEKYYLLAIEAGEMDAYLNLAEMFQDMGDTQAMLKYYQLAIDKGHAEAMVRLAYHYNEVGDHDNEKKYILMADDPAAMFRLGRFYGGKGDHEKQMLYYKMAVKKEYMPAILRMAEIYYNTANYNKMKKYCHMAIDKGSCDAMVLLGRYYYYKENDKQKMKQFYKMAIDLGYGNAMAEMAQYYYGRNDKRHKRNAYYFMALQNNVDDWVNFGFPATLVDENDYQTLLEFHMMYGTDSDIVQTLEKLAEREIDDKTKERIQTLDQSIIDNCPAAIRDIYNQKTIAEN